MSQHTPHHPHEATTGTGATAGTGPTPTHLNQTDATQTDLVAGDPPVPLTVWRTAHTPADTGHGINARLATRLVAAYSRPREAVVDLTDGYALTGACAVGARRHHPAWFTDAASLIIGPATPPRPVAAPAPADTDEEDDLPDLGTWFGDDLTDDLPPSGGPTTEAPDNGSLQRSTSLVVARWPLDTTDAANRIRLAWLLTACARLLRPGGCLILVVATPPTTATTPEDYSQVVAAAAGTGLGYLQHIVAVTADINDGGGDAFVYHATDEELLTLAATTGDRWQVAHLRVHADLLVFSQPQIPQRRVAPHRGSRGGGRRG
jgi:hypothetical protein